MNDELIEQVLEKLVKGLKIEKLPEKQDWREIPKNYCFSKKRVERAVVLALETKQAEVLKLIDEHNNKVIKIPSDLKDATQQTAFIDGVNYEFEEFKIDLKKRLLAQSADCVLAKPVQEKKKEK